MKRIHALMLAALLFLAPTVGLADFTTDDVIVVIGDDFNGDFVAAVPEPTAALLMGVGLAIVGLAIRGRR